MLTGGCYCIWLLCILNACHCLPVILMQGHRPPSSFHDGIFSWHSQPPPTSSLKLWKNWHLVKSHAHEHLQPSRNITNLQFPPFKTTCACIFQYFLHYCMITREPFWRSCVFSQVRKVVLSKHYKQLYCTRLFGLRCTIIGFLKEISWSCVLDLGMFNSASVRSTCLLTFEHLMPNVEVNNVSLVM